MELKSLYYKNTDIHIPDINNNTETRKHYFTSLLLFT